MNDKIDVCKATNKGKNIRIWISYLNLNSQTDTNSIDNFIYRIQISRNGIGCNANRWTLYMFRWYCY